MQAQTLPWPVAAFVLIMVIGFGGGYLFFADHLCDWQIRQLQSRWTRLFYRFFGLVTLLGGAVIAFAMSLTYFR